MTNCKNYDPIQEALDYAESLIEDVRTGNDTWTQVLDRYTVADLKTFFEALDPETRTYQETIPDVCDLAEYILDNMILAEENYLKD